MARESQSVEPSAGEREGLAPRMKEPSAGEREGLAPRIKEPSAGEREGLAPRKRAPARYVVADHQAAFDAHADTLHRSGVVQQRHVDGLPFIRFDAQHCPGCNGRCGVGVSAPPLGVPEALDLPVGTEVLVTASARALRRRALRVFGPPLLAVSACTTLAHFGAWTDWALAGAAVLGIAVSPALARLKSAA